jgi:hypothetical protein
MQLQPNGKDLNPEPSQKMVYKIDKLAIPGIYPYDWDDLFISHKMVGFYGMFFFFKLGLQQKVLCMIRLAKDSTSPEMFDDLAMISSVLVRVFSSL